MGRWGRSVGGRRRSPRPRRRGCRSSSLQRPMRQTLARSRTTSRSSPSTASARHFPISRTCTLTAEPSLSPRDQSGKLGAMSDLVLAVPIHFTIEFLAFLVFSGAAALVASGRTLIGGLATNRIEVALGFALLAVMEVVHGAAFVAADSSEVLSAGSALGFALIVVGLAGTAGDREPSRTLSVGATMLGGRVAPLAFVPAVGALVVALVAAVGAGKDRIRG